MGRGQRGGLWGRGGAGWAVIRLDGITPGNAANVPDRIAAVQGAFSQVLGREYLEEFAHAARKVTNARSDPAAVARVKADLLKRSAASGE